jgi:membrane protease YdiL (CAAX protease family)
MASTIENDPIPEPNPTAEPDPPVSSRSDRALWMEVIAVLAIGVLPALSNALVLLWQGPGKPVPPYWLDSLDLSLRSACVSFAVLYVIHRSGEPWSSFGITRLELTDLGLGLMVFFASLALTLVVFPFLPASTRKPDAFFPLPQNPLDYILLLIKYAANGFAEELVVRAYLITRLERLLKSPLLAVVLSALFFGSYHLYYGPWGAFQVAVLGLVYGVLFVLLPRVWPFAAGHMLYSIFLELDVSLS